MGSQRCLDEQAEMAAMWTWFWAATTRQYDQGFYGNVEGLQARNLSGSRSSLVLAASSSMVALMVRLLPSMDIRIEQY
jgi:hypothetical protein